MRLYGRHGVVVACEAPAFDLRHSLERITGTRHYGFGAGCYSRLWDKVVGMIRERTPLQLPLR